MKTMTRLTDREYLELMNLPKVLEAMAYRCEEQGHDYENCCSVTFRVYQRCKWCGENRS